MPMTRQLPRAIGVLVVVASAALALVLVGSRAAADFGYHSVSVPGSGTLAPSAIRGGAYGATLKTTDDAGTVAWEQGTLVSATVPTQGQTWFLSTADAGVWTPTSFSGDISCSTSTPGSCSVVNVTQVNPFTYDYSAALTTNDATLTTIFTEPAEVASTTYDYIGTITGQNTPTDGGASAGDLYRADFAFDEQRLGSAAPTAAGASPLPLNVRTTGAGNTWPGITFSVSGNSVIFQVQGLATTTIIWHFQVTRIVTNPQ